MKTRYLQRLFPFVILFLAACSMPGMVWNYVDRTLAAQLNEWLALDTHQQRTVDAHTNEWLDQIRSEFGPRYLDFTQRVTDTAETELTYHEMRPLLDDADALYRKSVATALPWVAELLVTLSAAQVDHLAARIDEGNTAYREEHLHAEPAERRALFAERFITQTERWTGSLDARQQAQIRKLSQAFPETGEQWFTYRSRQQEELLRLLREGADAQDIQAHLHCWWVDRCDQRPDETAASEAFIDGIAVMIVELDQLLTPRQRNRAISTLRTRAGNLESLLR